MSTKVWRGVLFSVEDETVVVVVVAVVVVAVAVVVAVPVNWMAHGTWRRGCVCMCNGGGNSAASLLSFGK